MSSESNVQASIRLEAARLGHGMWRNNSGACKDETGRLIRFGLGNDSAKINSIWKSPDLIGIHKDTGQLVGVEVKGSLWNGVRVGNDREQAQRNALIMMHKLNALVGFARSVEDFHAILRGETPWLFD